MSCQSVLFLSQLSEIISYDSEAPDGYEMEINQRDKLKHEKEENTATRNH